jgi:PAS domain S-box-containing protein
MNDEAGGFDPALLGPLILDQMLDAVVLADADGVIRLWNRGAEVLFGYSASEAIGAPLDLIVPQRMRAAHGAGFKAAVLSGHLKSHGKVLTTRANHKFGCRLYVDFSFGLLKDDSGALLGVFAVGRDATARHMEQLAMAAETH